MLGFSAPRPLAGQLVLLTGASRGVGAALALALAAEGCDLCLCARTPGDLTQVQAECASAAAGRSPPGRCITIVADVASQPDCGRLVAQCRNVFDRAPDVLINNAAETGCSGPFAQVKPDEVVAMLAANVAAPLMLSRLLLPDMLQRGSGTIVNISSVCGFIALPGAATYCATKAALNSFTIALRAELQGTGVRVLSICPTSVTDGGAYDRLMKDIAANGNQSHARSSMAWLYEVPLDGVVRGVLAQLRWGAPYALVPLTLLPVRLLGALQQLAPDWFTAVLQSPRVLLNPLRFMQAVGTAGASTEALKKGVMEAAGRKEE